MKCLKLSLVCLLLAVVYAEEKTNEGLDLPEIREKTASSEKRWAQENQAYQPQPSYSTNFPEIKFGTDPKTQERATHEKTFKDFLGYEAIQSVLINALKPKPIVDTAEESEKLAPNDGSTAQFLGDLVVRGTETLSRALNTVIDGPKQAITKLSAGATQALNQLGAYLVGL